MKRLPLTLLLLTSALLPSCMSMRTTVPDLQADLHYTAELAARYQIDTQWWKIYRDEQLDSLVQTALSRNIDLAKSAVSVNRALYQANLIGADLLPAFSASGEGTVTKNTKSGEPSVRSYEGRANVSYEVDLWRKLANAASAQEWEYKATVEDLNTARFALVNSVVDAYFHLAYLSEAIKATSESVEFYRKINELTQTKYSLGKVDSSEPALSKQSLLQAENTLLSYQAEQKIAEETLRNLLNYAPGQPLSITYSSLESMEKTTVDLEVPLAVLANRPDLKAAQFRLESAFKDLQATEKSWLPTITIGAAISGSAEHAKQTFDVPFTSGNVSINLPFLQWNTIKWNVKISEADYETARLDYEQSLTTALNEVDTYYYRFVNAGDTYAKIKEKYAYDRKLGDYYETRYTNGKSELSDWLNEMNTIADSRTSMLRARYDMLQYENFVYKAMAGRYTGKTAPALPAGFAQQP